MQITVFIKIKLSLGIKSKKLLRLLFSESPILNQASETEINFTFDLIETGTDFKPVK